MGRFETEISKIVTFVGFLGGGIAVISFALRYLSAAAVLAALAAFISGTALYLIYKLGTVVEERIDEVEAKVDSGFSESLSALEEADEDEYPKRADGGSWRSLDNLNVEKVEFSGIPSIAGAAMGGALGALAGPAGAGVGATLGAIIGGGKEYQDLRDVHQDRLERTAWIAAEREVPIRSDQLELEAIEDVSGLGGDYWRFDFVDIFNTKHQVRISKSDGSVEFRTVPEEGTQK